eukprot:TRINITY_DN6319_c0_g2_i11.p1 TRINITY_DN6319_c0_g2~~TRINITY_DN6319_c0_g2_i11.p1  ORF type:complete len:100 (-),score=22.79 TRINITY_DN6319_c0_g2_i11:131-430(-)
MEGVTFERRDRGMKGRKGKRHNNKERLERVEKTIDRVESSIRNRALLEPTSTWQTKMENKIERLHAIRSSINIDQPNKMRRLTGSRRNEHLANRDTALV